MNEFLLKYEKIIFEITKVTIFSIIIRMVLLGTRISMENLTEVGDILLKIIYGIFALNVILFIKIYDIHFKKGEKININISGYDILITLCIVAVLALFFTN